MALFVLIWSLLLASAAGLALAARAEAGRGSCSGAALARRPRAACRGCGGADVRQPATRRGG